VVSYIGSLDSELYEQLSNKLPILEKKHEDLNRLCLGCLANGGHQNRSNYSYRAELELTSGGTIEYAVAATGNKRETCEVPEGGGLLIVDINSTDGGIIKLKRKQIQGKEFQNATKISEVSQKKTLSTDYELSKKEAEIANLKTKIKSLENLVGERGANLVRTETELGEKHERLNELEEEANHFRNEKEKLEEMIKKLKDKSEQISDEQ